MDRNAFLEAALEAARARTPHERHEAHVFPHPVWDGGDVIQLHVWEDPEDSPDFFVEINAPLVDAFRAGLGGVLERIAAGADPDERLRSERALLVAFYGFWMERPRIEEGIMKRMLVLTGWSYRDPRGGPCREGFADAPEPPAPGPAG